MTEPAGTPAADPKASETAPTSVKPKDDSAEVTVSAQFKKEALENWKPAAEKVNKLEAELAAERARIAQLERMAYGGGQQATDPRVARIAQLQEQAQYDPVAAEVLETKREVLMMGAEKWLTEQLLEEEVPKSRRESVSALIRASGYQMSVRDALNRVTDPETKTLAERLSEMEKENERLRNAKPNGVSPASVVPATASAEDGAPTTMKRSDYVAVLQRASAEGASEEDRARARTLKQAAGSNKLKWDNE